MNQALIEEIQSLIQKLSGEMSTLSTAATKQIDDLNAAVNGIASHTLAIEGILVALAAKADLDPEKITAWIRSKTDKFADDEQEGVAAENLMRDLLS